MQIDLTFSSDMLFLHRRIRSTLSEYDENITSILVSKQCRYLLTEVKNYMWKEGFMEIYDIG